MGDQKIEQEHETEQEIERRVEKSWMEKIDSIFFSREKRTGKNKRNR